MKIVPNVFKIDKSQKSLEGLLGTKSIVQHIIRHAYKKKNKELSNDELILTEFTKDNTTYFLYVYRTNDKESDWSRFLPSELKKTSEFAQSKVNLVLFIDTELDTW